MAEILSTVSLVSYLAGAVFGAAAIVFWFLFKIPSIIGDLSGRNARKSIQKMRANNEKSGNKSYRPNSFNIKRGKLTEKMEERKGGKPGQPYETGILKENRAESHRREETALLVEEEGTRPLEEGTATELLAENERKIERKNPSVNIQMIEEVILLHTEEVI